MRLHIQTWIKSTIFWLYKRLETNDEPKFVQKKVKNNCSKWFIIDKFIEFYFNQIVISFLSVDYSITITNKIENLFFIITTFFERIYFVLFNYHFILILLFYFLRIYWPNEGTFKFCFKYFICFLNFSTSYIFLLD